MFTSCQTHQTVFYITLNLHRPTALKYLNYLFQVVLLFFSLAGSWCAVRLSVHEKIRRRRDVPPPPHHLPPPPVRGQRLQWPVPAPRILLAPTEARPQHLGALQRHLHSAQPDAAGASKEHPPSGRADQPPLCLLLSRQPPDAPAGCWIPLHAHPAQVAPLAPSGSSSSHDHAAFPRASPSLSHPRAHERLPLLGGGSVTRRLICAAHFRCGWEEILSFDHTSFETISRRKKGDFGIRIQERQPLRKQSLEKLKTLQNCIGLRDLNKQM